MIPERINAILSGVAVPLLLCFAGIFYCVRLRAFHIRRPIFVIRMLIKDSGKGLSSVSAMSLALAGTLGVGNIVGVASAIHLGGFGAVFWIWVSALLSMILKYAEIVLAMGHKRGGMGSAMYYIRDFFQGLGASRVGAAVAAVFAVSFLVCSLTMGSMLQSGAVSEAMELAFGIPPLAVGVTLGALTLIAALGGTRRLTRLAGLLVPVMSLGYIVMSVLVIFKNRQDMGDVFYLIFKNAFSLRTAAGGVGGFAFMRAVRYGVMRGLVSNEAGCGTAPTAHALSTSDGATQGLWGIFEVFTDTVMLCTLTALVLISEYPAAAPYEGHYMTMCMAAFGACLGTAAEYFLAVGVLCFGFATVICWVHYGMSAAMYLFPPAATKYMFIFIYCGAVVLGACVSSEGAWLLSDISMSVMTVINLCVITQMWREVKQRSTDKGFIR